MSRIDSAPRDGTPTWLYITYDYCSFMEFRAWERYRYRNNVWEKMYTHGPLTQGEIIESDEYLITDWSYTLYKSHPDQTAINFRGNDVKGEFKGMPQRAIFEELESTRKALVKAKMDLHKQTQKAEEHEGMLELVLTQTSSTVLHKLVGEYLHPNPFVKVRKKPVQVEAFQWLGFDEGPQIPEVTRGRASAKADPHLLLGLAQIDTLEDVHIVTPNDWIIRGVKGEYYACKPDIFKMTYTVLPKEG